MREKALAQGGGWWWGRAEKGQRERETLIRLHAERSTRSWPDPGQELDTQMTEPPDTPHLSIFQWESTEFKCFHIFYFLNFLWKEEFCFVAVLYLTLKQWKLTTLGKKKNEFKRFWWKLQSYLKQTNNNVVPCLLLLLCQVERKQTFKGGEGGWR